MWWIGVSEQSAVGSEHPKFWAGFQFPISNFQNFPQGINNATSVPLFWRFNPRKVVFEPSQASIQSYMGRIQHYVGSIQSYIGTVGFNPILLFSKFEATKIGLNSTYVLHMYYVYVILVLVVLLLVCTCSISISISM